jgi:23S rRNA (guanosine2251-2'-O)-methyltransferase
VHQGLLAEADPLPSPAIEDMDPSGIVLVLDQITDPHNVGAILRTAAAFAVAAIVTTARHSPDATGVLAKSASGALELVPIVIVQNLARALAGLKERGFLTVGLDSNAPDDLAAIELRAPLALVLGAETAWRGSIFPARSKASTCRTPLRSPSTLRRARRARP